jgi:hypothetical protein
MRAQAALRQGMVETLKLGRMAAAHSLTADDRFRYCGFAGRIR